MARAYDVGLSWARRHHRSMLLLTLATVGINGYLFARVPKGFFPQQDTGRLSGAIQAAQDIPFEAMKGKLATDVDISQADPTVESVMGFTGGGGGSPLNTGRVFSRLTRLGERGVSTDHVTARLRGKLARVPGPPAYLQAVQDLRIGGMASNAQYQYTLQGNDLDELNAWTPRVTEALRGLRQVADLNSNQQDRGLEASLVIDRPTASRLGVTPKLLDNTLYDAFGQRQVSITYTLLNQYHVVMEVEPRFWQRPDTLRDIYVRTPAGQEVPLSAFTRFEPRPTALAVNHQDRKSTRLNSSHT